MVVLSNDGAGAGPSASTAARPPTHTERVVYSRTEWADVGMGGDMQQLAGAVCWAADGGRSKAIQVNDSPKARERNAVKEPSVVTPNKIAGPRLRLTQVPRPLPPSPAAAGRLTLFFVLEQAHCHPAMNGWRGVAAKETAKVEALQKAIQRPGTIQRRPADAAEPLRQTGGNGRGCRRLP